ncbi:hypothetical protein OSCI_2790004 [Kamptonema sp. PCC 6506]|nr:hypothetical protein OSCI_2790004 [Kamptonema sp. PCC 6506]
MLEGCNRAITIVFSGAIAKETFATELPSADTSSQKQPAYEMKATLWQ